jgi:transposase-like protein
MRWTPERRAEAHRLYVHEGKTYAEIAVAMGIRRNQVAGALAKLKLRPDKPPVERPTPSLPRLRFLDHA